MNSRSSRVPRKDGNVAVGFKYFTPMSHITKQVVQRICSNNRGRS